jgi:uncharacterized MnhB-related membrane protein
MNIFHLTILVLTALAGTATVLTRNPFLQSLVASFYGLLLAILFLSFQAPDVAFSELVVGSGAIPLMILITAYKTRDKKNERVQP